MQALMDITKQLEMPFLVQDIDLLPKGAVERDGKTLCMALPYADVRVYEDRLNAVAPGEWSTPPPTALAIGQKIIVYVTVIICGIAHTDVGEASASGENAGTESWAQAFKRACSQFGLGRYLYDLEKAWVPYDKQRKQIALDAQGKQNIVRQMYTKARIAAQKPEQNTSGNGHTPTSPQDEMQHALPASDIAALKAKWVAAYTIADEQIEARWKKYLQYLLKLDEAALKKFHAATIARDLAAQSEKLSVGAIS